MKPLSRLSKITQLEKEEREQLVIDLINGDENAIEPLVLSFIPLAHNLAKRYSVGNLEDMTGEAMNALVIAVHRACGNKPRPEGSRLLMENKRFISSYLSQNIKNALEKFRSEDRLIHIPLSTLKKSVRLGNELEIPTRSSDLELQNLIYEDVHEFDGENSFEDIITDLGLCETEVKIIKMRMEGLNLETIGREFGRSRQWVLNKIKNIRKQARNLDV